ncbi:complex I subunit 1/NuoH family protein [Candidatus Amoebophilus asiaticus]|nr:complex I subunit 1 family protein [Candidatus Amoebophilus asiaticus]
MLTNIPTFCFYLPFLLLFMLVAIYVERKLAAFIQDRLGPMEVGYKGALQTLADLIKLLKKEVIIPEASDKALFILAPVWILVTVIAGFVVVPVNNAWTGAPTSIGLLFLLAMLSLKTIGILVAGWSSNNKFARLGALRAMAQFLAYEIPLGLSVLCVIIACRNVDLSVISSQQGLSIYNVYKGSIQTSYLLGIKGLDVSHMGGFLSWNIFRMPCLIVAYSIFFLTSLAVSNKIPFDLAESESELIAGYHTEYSGIYWAWIMVSEYSILFLMSIFGVILFWGGWNSPLPNIGSLKLALYTNGHPNTWVGNIWAFFWLFTKALLFVLIQLWIKWTFPRLRADQLLRVCWLYLIPLGLGCLLVTLWWEFLNL